MAPGCGNWSFPFVPLRPALSRRDIRSSGDQSPAKPEKSEVYQTDIVTMNQRLIRLAVGTLVGLVIAAGIAWWQVSSMPGGSRPGDSTRTGTALIGGPFSLVDQ